MPTYLGTGPVTRGGRTQTVELDSLATSDTDLLRGIVERDEGALERVYDTYARAVYEAARRKLCNARLAEDVVQHVFIVLWNHPERFDPRRGPLRAYLLMLTHCHSVDLIRSETARRQRETVDGMTAHDAAVDPESALLGSHEVAALHEAFDVLTDPEREAIELAFFGGHTYREVAILLDEPEGTVKSRIRLGLGRLRSAMSD